eukprot:978874-Pyramimonas_sp.AAC.1
MGLKTSLVDAAASRNDIKSRMGRIFYHNDVPVPEPPGTAQPKLPCCMKHGGLCKCDVAFDAVENFVKSFNFSARDYDLPLFLELSGPDGESPENDFLCERIGQGDMHVLIKAFETIPNSMTYEIARGPKRDNALIYTSHL